LIGGIHVSQVAVGLGLGFGYLTGKGSAAADVDGSGTRDVRAFVFPESEVVGRAAAQEPPDRKDVVIHPAIDEDDFTGRSIGCVNPIQIRSVGADPGSLGEHAV
jgi:hypothetical protein